MNPYNMAVLLPDLEGRCYTNQEEYLILQEHSGDHEDSMVDSYRLPLLQGILVMEQKMQPLYHPHQPKPLLRLLVYPQATVMKMIISLKRDTHLLLTIQCRWIVALCWVSLYISLP